jgi:hypothetical protein
MFLEKKILFFAAVLTLPVLASAVQGPKLVCDEPVFNFGRVDPSVTLTNVFTLRNEGDLSFVIKHVKTSCGCTKARLNKWIIAPGETARLTAIYSAARRKGPQKKALAVISKSGEPALMLYMAGFVEPHAASD